MLHWRRCPDLEDLCAWLSTYHPVTPGLVADWWEEVAGRIARHPYGYAGGWLPEEHHGYLEAVWLTRRRHREGICRYRFQEQLYNTGLVCRPSGWHERELVLSVLLPLMDEPLWRRWCHYRHRRWLKERGLAVPRTRLLQILLELSGGAVVLGPEADYLCTPWGAFRLAHRDLLSRLAEMTAPTRQEIVLWLLAGYLVPSEGVA